MHHKNRGFTLIEILIALFIFTIVSVMMVSALHNIFNYQSETEKNAARLNELQTALLLMSRDIEQTINRPIITGKNSFEAALFGAAHSVTFTHAGLANPFGALHRSTLQRTSYSLKGETLVRETWDTLDPASETQKNSRTLLSNVSNLVFDYLDEKRNFHAAWPPPDDSQLASLPRAVRVSLTIKNWGTLTQLYLIPGQNLAKSS